MPSGYNNKENNKLNMNTFDIKVNDIKHNLHLCNLNRLGMVQERGKLLEALLDGTVNAKTKVQVTGPNGTYTVTGAQILNALGEAAAPKDLNKTGVFAAMDNTRPRHLRAYLNADKVKEMSTKMKSTPDISRVCVDKNYASARFNRITLC